MVWTRDDGSGAGGGGGGGSSDTDYDYSNRFFFQARTNERFFMTFPFFDKLVLHLIQYLVRDKPFLYPIAEKNTLFSSSLCPPKSGCAPPPLPPPTLSKTQLTHLESKDSDHKGCFFTGTVVVLAQQQQHE